MDPNMEQSKPSGKWHIGIPISKMLASALSVGRVILRQKSGLDDESLVGPSALLSACASLVEHQGEASGLALAEQILSAYEALAFEEKAAFFQGLAQDFLVDQAGVAAAAVQYQEQSNPASMNTLRKALEPRCNRLFRRLNQVPDATGRLVKLRGDLLQHESTHPQLKQVDDDLKRLLLIWFNLGFLSLRRISWDSPASTLEKLIEYEAVHEIRGWGDLRSRLKEDRRLFAYFHPAMPDDPIIFVQVALRDGGSSAIGPLVQEDRILEDTANTNTATFYSISNCHKGLRGISFGNFLIKQVASELRSEFPHLTRFETLSPIPGFRAWVAASLKGATTHTLPTPVWDRLGTYLEDIDDDFDANPLAQDTLLPLCAHYLTHEKKDQLPIDPVAKFHLGNGALLDKIHWRGDESDRGKQLSYGVMVNYVYEPEEIENRHEAFFSEGRIAASASVKNLADSLTGQTG
jgi:malonyl-CoA decarboxylase